MRYAIIAYGSLVWDLDDLAGQVEGPWLAGAGPALPVEFSRISPKRRRALVLCIDPHNGTPCPTSVIASLRGTIGAVVADLAQRERAALHHVGAVCLASGIARGRDPSIVARVAAWCRAGGWQGAVWTELPANFEAVTGTPFSPAVGRAYLAGLAGEALAEAVRYIEEAPAATDTPLRRLLAADPWWRGVAAGAAVSR